MAPEAANAARLGERCEDVIGRGRAAQRIHSGNGRWFSMENRRWQRMEIIVKSGNLRVGEVR